MTLISNVGDGNLNGKVISNAYGINQSMDDYEMKIKKRC